MGMRTRSEPAPALLNREAERAALDSLLADVRSGRGRALVIRGEAGAGSPPAASSGKRCPAAIATDRWH